jgi:hypothetical protein
VHEDVTFGIEASYRIFNERKDTMVFDHKMNGLSFTGNYYFNNALNISDKWYLYGGINIGFYKWVSPEGYFEIGKSSSKLAIGTQIGGRHYWKEFGIFMEVNAGTEIIGGRLGVSYRLRY